VDQIFHKRFLKRFCHDNGLDYRCTEDLYASIMTTETEFKAFYPNGK